MMNWGDLTIRQYEEITKAYEENDDDLIYKLIAIVKGISYDEVLEKPWNEVEKWAADMKFLSTQEPKARMARREYVINGKEYETSFDMTSITTAQYIDFQMTAPQSKERVAEFLSIILIPKGKTYNKGYNIQEVQEDIYNYFKIEDAMGLSAFFLHLFQKSIRYAERRLRKMLRKIRRTELTEEQAKAIGTIEEVLQSLDTLKL